MLRDQMLAVMADVNAQVAEREELVECIAIALLTRKNLFILGAPGQAKSYAINAFRNRITGARQFERLLSKQTDEEQLFGRIDLSSLLPGSVTQAVLDGDPQYQQMHASLKNRLANGQDAGDLPEQMERRRKALAELHGGEPQVNTTGKIPEADVIFLDEIFKCNDGVLNSLLTALNERKYTNEGHTYQEIIGRYHPLSEVKLSTDIQRKEYGRIPMLEKVGLFSVLENLSSPVRSAYPQSMEKLGQNYGYLLYRSPLDTEDHIERLRLWKANDRANVFVDGKPAATLYDLELQREKTLDISFQQGAILDILMENIGRVNFGPRLEEQRKGINQCVEVNNHTQSNWQQYPLPLDNLDRLDFSKEYQPGLPGFYRFTFEITEAADTFLDFSGWGKGYTFVNGFNIGRFWEIGPQRRLYVPGPLLKIGKNEIILFETDGKANDYITLTDKPDIG